MHSNSHSRVTLGQMAFSYLSIPLLVGIALFDSAFFNHAARNWLPLQPEMWAPWVLIFGMPHVLASWQSFADREYLDHYGRKRIVLFVCAFIAGTLFLYQFSPNVLFAVFVGSIIHHTIAQQFGIAMSIIGGGPTWLYRLWKYSMVLAGVALYVMLYFAEPHDLLGFVDGKQFTPWFGYVRHAAEVLTALSVIFGLAYYTRATRGRELSDKAKLYLWGTMAMGPAFLVLFEAGYFAFVIALGRLIHEGAAWFIYIRHDSNRSRDGCKNVIYRMLAFTRIPVPALVPLVAFGVGIPMGMLALRSDLFWAVTLAFSLIHYHMEGVIWRGSHIHRQHLSFARA